MAMEIMEKVGSFAAIAIGQVQGPILERYVDQKMVADAATKDPVKYPSPALYPMYQRTAVMVPLVTGIPALILGLAADKIMPGKLKESTQRTLLQYGTSATIGGAMQVWSVADQRQKLGYAPFMPKTQQQAPQQQQQAQAAVRTNGYGVTNRQYTNGARMIVS